MEHFKYLIFPPKVHSSSYTTERDRQNAIKNGGIRVRIYYWVRDATHHMNLSDEGRQTATGLALTVIAISSIVYSWVHQSLTGVIFGIFAIIVIFIALSVFNILLGYYFWILVNFDDFKKYIKTLFGLTGATFAPWRAAEAYPGLDFITTTLYCAIGAVIGVVMATIFIKIIQTIKDHWEIYAILAGMIIMGVLFGE